MLPPSSVADPCSGGSPPATLDPAFIRDQGLWYTSRIVELQHSIFDIIRAVHCNEDDDEDRQPGPDTTDGSTGSGGGSTYEEDDDTIPGADAVW